MLNAGQDGKNSIHACYVVETSDSMLMVYIAAEFDSDNSVGERRRTLLLASSTSALTLGVDFGGERTAPR